MGRRIVKIPAPEGELVTEDRRGRMHFLAWATQVSAILTGLTTADTTANRPTTYLWQGRMYYDTTLGQPIWYTGSGWVDATGAGV